MPTTKSAKKRLRQSLERRDTNRATKKAIKTQYRKVMDAVKSGNPDQAQKELSQAAKQLDHAATKNVIHSNAAARTKSRLAAKIKKLKNK